MSKFWNFILGVHKFNNVNKYNLGDVCFWPSAVDSMVEPTVKIIDWHPKYDRVNKKEMVLYDGVDIYTGKRWENIKEDELQILAFADEVSEMTVCGKDTVALFHRGIHLFS